MTPDLSSFLSGLINHLWQSTLFAGIVAALVLTMRRHSAGLRHAMWCVASAKFLVPFSLLTAIGRAVDWPSPTRRMTMPLSRLAFPEVIPAAAEPQARRSIALFAAVLALVWLAGFALVVFRRLRAGRHARNTVRSVFAGEIPAALKTMRHTARVGFSNEVASPAVFGVFRPTLVLPPDIEDRLKPGELAALVAHELAHVRRRDNLIATAHTLLTAVFWFHPVVWWIGRQMVRERERACDEAALREGFEPHVYATGLMKVCRFVLSPTPAGACAAVAQGSELKRRMEGIVNFRHVRRSGPMMRLAIGTFLVAAVLVPVAIGLGGSGRQGQYLSNWLQEDATYIITNEERQAFEGLTTDEEKYQFIEQFWLRRDPTPDTVRNEFQEVHYQRIAYANQHFASGIPGYQTDRGQIYIRYGPPDEIESSTAREVWRYRYIEGLGQNVRIEFVDPAGSNEFRLVTVPGQSLP